jgi:hypothetical protein
MGLVNLPARRLPVAFIVLPGFKPVRIRLPVNFGPPFSTSIGRRRTVLEMSRTPRSTAMRALLLPGDSRVNVWISRCVKFSTHQVVDCRAAERPVWRPGDGVRLTCPYLLDSPCQLLGCTVLEQVTRSRSLKRGSHDSPVVMDAEDHNLRPRVTQAYLSNQ